MTVEGKPSGTSLLSISFSGMNGKPVSVPVAPDGTYLAEGVAVGQVLVAIGVIDLEADRAAERAQRPPEAGQAPKGEDAKPQTPRRETKPAVPGKFTDPVTSGLKLTTETGTNKYDVDIK